MYPGHHVIAKFARCAEALSCPKAAQNARSKLDVCDAKSMDDDEHSARLDSVMAGARVGQSDPARGANVIVQ